MTKLHFTELNQCPLCGSPHSKKVFLLDDTNVVQCCACGFRWLNPYLNEEMMKKVYQESDSLKDVQEHHENYYEYDCLKKGSKTRRDYEKVLDYLEERFKDVGSKSVFEIGYGNGSLLAFARQRGWQVDGIDASSSNQALAKKNYELDLKCGFFSSSVIDENSVDALVLWDLIEHIPNPVEMMADLKKYLKKDGVIVIATPNAGGLLNKLVEGLYSVTFGRLKGPLKKLYVYVHTTYFTKRHLEILADRSGYKKAFAFLSSTDLKRYQFSLISQIFISTVFLLAKIINMSNRIVFIAEKR